MAIRIFNETRNCFLANNAVLATKTFDRMKGLLGRKELEKESGMIIDPCASIHTFFMKFSIDVLFVDRNGTIISKYDKLAPWRMTRIHGKSRCVIELPAGCLTATETMTGDRIRFIESAEEVFESE